MTHQNPFSLVDKALIYNAI